MNDYIIRATAANGQIRAFAATTKETVETARQAHDTSPIITAGLGRLLTAGGIMGCMLKGDRDLLTLKVEGSGDARILLVTADSHGNVKGYPGNPHVFLPANAKGKLDVAGAVGVGVLTVIKDLGLKEPYSGSCELITSEIAEDITYYFATSEQTPSTVGLGVLMTKENTVDVAGGFVIQLMPDVEEETIQALEEKIAQVTSVTDLLSKGMTPEDILQFILGELDLQILDKVPVNFHCDCSRERVSKALASIGKEDLQSLIEDAEPVEIKCHFCNTVYNFRPDELRNFIN